MAIDIQIQFAGGTIEWHSFISESAKTASSVMSDPAFVAKVRGWPAFDSTASTSSEVADKIEHANVVTVTVGFYHHPLGPSIAKEEAGRVLFNTSKRSRGAGSPGNIAHEVMHVLGFSHNGNSIVGNENTVPYRIGEFVDDALTGDAAVARE